MQELFGLHTNKFDYLGVKDNLLSSKIHYKKYVPLVVEPAMKPELIVWQNLDYVNKDLTMD